MSQLANLTEDHLLQLAADGHREAFGILYKKYMNDIYCFILYKIGKPNITEDLTDETFLRAWENLPRIYDNENKLDNFRAFLYRIARNLVIDLYRKKKDMGIEINDNPIPSSQNSPEELVIYQHSKKTNLQGCSKSQTLLSGNHYPSIY